MANVKTKVQNNTDKPDEEEKTVLNFIATIVGLALAIIFVAVFLYFLKFRGQLSNDQAVWGAFGDFVGGIANPVLSFFSLVALLITLVLQRKELSYTRKELEMTREELERSATANETAAKAAEIQLEKLQQQNNFSNYYKHIEEFEKYMEKIIQKEDYTGHSISPSEVLVVHRLFWPNAKLGDFKTNLEVFEKLSEYDLHQLAQQWNGGETEPFNKGKTFIATMDVLSLINRYCPTNLSISKLQNLRSLVEENAPISRITGKISTRARMIADIVKFEGVELTEEQKTILVNLAIFSYPNEKVSGMREWVMLEQ